MALQNLCLETIIEHFDRYYAAFCTSDDANMKRMLEFLQRVYSYEIATEIEMNREIEEKYLDFVINKYLKALVASWFSSCTWKATIVKIAEIGRNIKKLDLDDCANINLWPKLFCHFPNLEVIHIHGSCSNDVLFAIAKFCHNITEIDIQSTGVISDEGFEALCKKKKGKVPCPKLKKLFLGPCDVSETVAAHLIQNLPSLEFLDILDLPLTLYTMHEGDLHQLDKIPPYKLKNLDFVTTTIFPEVIAQNPTNILKVCFSVCPFLTTLSCLVYEPQHLDLLLGLSHLETLQLLYDKDNSKHDQESLDINNLLKSIGNKLTSLNVNRCSFSVSTLVESCPALKVLSVNRVSFDQHGGSIPLFRNLGSFSVEATEFNDNSYNLKSVCLILSSSPKLESIAFKQCNLIVNELKTEIVKCCQHCCVNNVDFNASSVDKPFVMDILLTCPSLKSFNLVDCGLTSFDEEEIYRCAEILPNSPEIYFPDQLSVSDFDDIFDDYYDNDFDGDDYDDEYDDYLYHTYDDDDDDDDGGAYEYFI